MAAAACTQERDPKRSLTIESRPVGFERDDPKQTSQGKIVFRGGLELRSSDRDFGGLSSLLISPDGKQFISISDESHWVIGTLSYKDGRLTDAEGKTIAPMLDLDGIALIGKAGDAEGLATGDADGGFGDLFISFEGNHRVWRYPFSGKGVRSLPVNIPLPREALNAPGNGGLEGITRFSDGRLIAVTEHDRNKQGNYRAWILPFTPVGKTPDPAPDALKPKPVSFKPISPFSMTDLRQLPGGDLLTLERHYDPVSGVRIQMRRIPLAAVERAAKEGPAVPLDGEIVCSLDGGYEIDNMEGLGVRVGEKGETLVYWVSDDNFNHPLQRTLLLMFELRP
ncbi:MAG TPA: esterase-like activity of phytase family protein [Candidatus Binatia bacterium]